MSDADRRYITTHFLRGLLYIFGELHPKSLWELDLEPVRKDSCNLSLAALRIKSYNGFVFGSRIIRINS